MMGVIATFVCIFVLILLLGILQQQKEHFTFNIATRMTCPTRNQSFDMRGDPLTIPRVELPSNNSGFGALHHELCPVRGDYIIGDL